MNLVRFIFENVKLFVEPTGIFYLVLKRTLPDEHPIKGNVAKSSLAFNLIHLIHLKIYIFDNRTSCDEARFP